MAARGHVNGGTAGLAGGGTRAVRPEGFLWDRAAPAAKDNQSILKAAISLLRDSSIEIFLL